MRRCIVCGTSIEGKRPHAIYCSMSCGQRARAKARAARMIAKMRLERPRCMICSKPIRYGEFGVRYTSATCGSQKCIWRRRDWFGRSRAS